MDTLLQWIEPFQSWVFEHLVLPAMFQLGIMSWADQAFDATGTALLGMGEILLVYLLLRPLEWLCPVERWDDRRGLRVDVLYTFLNRSGLVPYLGRHPIAAFLCYVAVIDFGEYVRHRLQHRFDWWWGLHSVHHSQRQLGLWADDRNHVLDGLLRAVWLAVIALTIGIPSEHFVGIVLFMRLQESLSHANVRLGFGWLGDRVLVSPRFHRIHHGIGVGHEGRHHGCNFAVLLPVWDVLLGTADFRRYFPATGIRDQLAGADYGRGFLGHQVDGLRRMFRALSGRGLSADAEAS